MKKIFQIFARDMRRLFTNPAAAIVMVGVCVLPSLYAWFNIAANMDPYGNPSNIKVAIANCDAGASTEMMSLDAGGTIVDTLKENKQLGWTFVDEKQAKAGVTSGKYYAAIVIPEDFSESLLSILDGEVKQPELDYYINEKKNAIAPKITATGASTIQQQINDTFSSVAAETVSELIRTSAGDLTGKIDKTNSELSTALSETRDNLKEYQKVLKNFKETSGSSEKLIKDALETLDAVSSAADSGSKTLTDTTALLATSRQTLGSFSSQFSNALSNSETLLNNTYASAVVKLGTFETKASQVNTVIGDSIDSVTALNQKQAELLDELQNLHESIGSDSTLSELISEKITALQQQNASFQELLDSLSTSNSSIQEAMTTAQNTRSSLEKLVADSRSSLQTYRNSLNESLIPKLSQSMDTLSALSGTLTATLSDVDPTVEQLKLILTQLDTSLSDSSAALGQTGGVLDTIDQQLSTIATDLGVLQSSDIYNQLITLKGLDADSISDFMSSPVSIRSEVLYEVENYGSGMTPFYTNLALWVGGLILPGILWPLACICDHGPDTGIYRVCRRYSLIKNPVPASDSIYPCRHILFVCICQPDLCNGSDIQTHRKSTCRSSGDLTDPRIFRNVSDRDDTGIFPETSSAASIFLWYRCDERMHRRLLWSYLCKKSGNSCAVFTACVLYRTGSSSPVDESESSV